MTLEERLATFKALDLPGAWVNGHDSKVDGVIVKLMWGDRRKMLKWAIAQTEEQIRQSYLDLGD
jgi:hypothetical protein